MEADNQETHSLFYFSNSIIFRVYTIHVVTSCEVRVTMRTSSADAQRRARLLAYYKNTTVGSRLVVYMKHLASHTKWKAQGAAVAAG